MAYVYCPDCGVGSHTNVRSCPQCGRRLRPARDRHGAVRRTWHRAGGAPAPREDIEAEVRDAIYGWRSGGVARRPGARMAERGAAERSDARRPHPAPATPAAAAGSKAEGRGGAARG